MGGPATKKLRGNKGWCRQPLWLVLYISVCLVTGIAIDTAEPKESDDDKIAFALRALDMDDPFTKHVPIDSDVIGAIEWMAKVW